MNAESKKYFYSKLPNDKIKINWNNNPIEMKLFLSFLTVPVIKSDNHLGASTGWTQYNNDDLKLSIVGGIVGKFEFLDNIRYGYNLDNPYNNYVNPFYLFNILNDDGKKFFTIYYRDDIAKLLLLKKQDILSLEIKLDKEREIYNIIKNEIEILTSSKGEL